MDLNARIEYIFKIELSKTSAVPSPMTHQHNVDADFRTECVEVISQRLIHLLLKLQGE